MAQSIQQHRSHLAIADLLNTPTIQHQHRSRLAIAELLNGPRRPENTNTNTNTNAATQVKPEPDLAPPASEPTRRTLTTAALGNMETGRIDIATLVNSPSPTGPEDTEKMSTRATCNSSASTVTETGDIKLLTPRTASTVSPPPSPGSDMYGSGADADVDTDSDVDEQPPSSPPPTLVYHRDRDRDRQVMTLVKLRLRLRQRQRQRQMG